MIEAYFWLAIIGIAWVGFLFEFYQSWKEQRKMKKEQEIERHREVHRLFNRRWWYAREPDVEILARYMPKTEFEREFEDLKRKK